MTWFCNACGWSGDPTTSRSIYRRAKGCTACGSAMIEPTTNRVKLESPNTVIQPLNKKITLLIQGLEKK